jgi:hypothetical protein
MSDNLEIFLGFIIGSISSAFKRYFKIILDLLGRYTVFSVKKKLTIDADKNDDVIKNMHVIYSNLKLILDGFKANGVYLHVFHNGRDKNFINDSIRYEMVNEFKNSKISQYQDKPMSWLIPVIKQLSDGKYFVYNKSVKSQYLSDQMRFYMENTVVLYPIINDKGLKGVIYVAVDADDVSDEVIQTIRYNVQIIADVFEKNSNYLV